MLQGGAFCSKGEHSAILSTFIKLPFVFKTIFMSIFEWPLKTGFAVFGYCNLFSILNHRSRFEVIKLFSFSTELSTKFQLLIKTKILTNKEASCFKSLRCCIYHANKC